jgi:hypothetical protein
MKISITIILILVGGSIQACSQEAMRGTAKLAQVPGEESSRRGWKQAKEEITVSEGGEISSAKIAAGRDMRLYEQAGHFDCRRWSEVALKNPQENNTRVEAALAAARRFIWEQWQNKRRGYIRLTFDSVDAASTSHIFIEPDADGRWQIFWRVARWHALLPSGVDDLPVIRAVVRPPPNGKAVLIFKGAHGEEQQVL